MLADLIAASTAPTAPGPHDAYDWWSDIWLPALVGVGSIAVAAVAIVIAHRSNRLAHAATKAAERSNAIARRASDDERKRRIREEKNEARAERQAFADRWMIPLRKLADQLENDPGFWSTPHPSTNSWLREAGPLMMEQGPRGYNDFPDEMAVSVIQRAGSASLGPTIVVQAFSSANALVQAWVHDPAGVKFWIDYYDKWVDREIERQRTS